MRQNTLVEAKKIITKQIKENQEFILMLEAIAPILLESNHATITKRLTDKIKLETGFTTSFIKEYSSYKLIAYLNNRIYQTSEADKNGFHTTEYYNETTATIWAPYAKDNQTHDTSPESVGIEMRKQLDHLKESTGQLTKELNSLPAIYAEAEKIEQAKQAFEDSTSYTTRQAIGII